MDYYLETNAIRQLASKLDHEILVNKCFTSVLVLIELASGIKDESSCIIRSSIISKILQSRLSICVMLPETLHFNAFGFAISDKSISSGIKRVLDVLINCDSYSTFKEKMLNSPDKKFLEFIYSYDKQAESVFPQFFNRNIDDARSSSGFKHLQKEFKSRWNSTDPNSATELYNKILDYLAKALHKRQNELGSFSKSLEQIKHDYDHSLDTWFIMSTLYADSHISFGSNAGKNDYFDLAHLMYLPNINTKIVSDDNLLHRLMIKSFAQNISTVAKFKETHNI